MPSIQRIALYILFDSLENDLVEHLRAISPDLLELTDEELAQAKSAMSRRPETLLDSDDPFDIVHGLHLGQKIDILLRNKNELEHAYAKYLGTIHKKLPSVIPVRNAIMHGRPLTVDEYALGFAFAQDLLKSRAYWPILSKAFSEYTKNPEALASRSFNVLDDPIEFGVMHNLPFPDYEDTGFLRRKSLEADLKRRILGRYPVITVQGDGGNGKTALTLHTVWNIIDSDDHSFDLILWYSAKTSSLTEKGITEIETSFSDSMSIIQDVATYADGSGDAFAQLLRVLEDNKILLIIDNLETVTGPYIERLVRDVPGESKLLLTSRVPISGDLPIHVPEFTDREGSNYLRILGAAHGIGLLRTASEDTLLRFCRRLGNKPLLIKWFALGVKSGASPERIISDPEDALRFCLENVLNRLSNVAIRVMEGLVAVSDNISPSVLGEMTSMSATEVDEGLLLLNRFGLVEFFDLANSERTFRLRPFVRSYVIRILSPDKELLNAYHRSYQLIQTRFQQSRAAERFNKYAPSNFVVRTPGEAVAEGKLRKLVRLLSRGEYEAVEDGIHDLKISDPGYFEVYRFEGFAAYTWSDIPRAIEAYEAALQYGENQSQLHFFYAGMLLRCGYADQASRQYAAALSIDPEAAPVLREAARAEMRRAYFDVARNYLERASASAGDAFKEKVLLLDLWIQYYQRYIDYFVVNRALDRAVEQCNLFLRFLQSCDMRYFDQTIVDHILKVEPSLRALIVEEKVDVKSARELRDWVRQNVHEAEELDLCEGRFIGRLKERGRRPTFGFLVTADDREFFLAAGNVERSIWQALNEGQAAEFSVRNKKDGRVEAWDVTLKD